MVHRRGASARLGNPADPPPTVVGGGPQRFVQYSQPVTLYRQHDRYLAEWRKLANLDDNQVKDRRDWMQSAEESAG